MPGNNLSYKQLMNKLDSSTNMHTHHGDNKSSVYQLMSRIKLIYGSNHPISEGINRMYEEYSSQPEFARAMSDHCSKILKQNNNTELTETLVNNCITNLDAMGFPGSDMIKSTVMNYLDPVIQEIITNSGMPSHTSEVVLPLINIVLGLMSANNEKKIHDFEMNSKDHAAFATVLETM